MTHSMPPLRRYDPDDPRARCDAPTPEQVDVVAALSAASRRLGDVGVRILTDPDAPVDWLALGDDMAAVARFCRQQVTIDGNRTFSAGPSA